MLFSYGSGEQQIEDNKKCRQIAGYFNCHVEQRGAHCPMDQTQGFTQSHWMPPLGGAHAIFPQRPPWLTNLLKQHKTLTEHNF